MSAALAAARTCQSAGQAAKAACVCVWGGGSVLVAGGERLQWREAMRDGQDLDILRQPCWQRQRAWGDDGRPGAVPPRGAPRSLVCLGQRVRASRANQRRHRRLVRAIGLHACLGALLGGGDELVCHAQ